MLTHVIYWHQVIYSRTISATSASTGPCSGSPSRSSSKSSQSQNEKPAGLGAEDSWNLEIKVEIKIKNTFIHFGEIENSGELQRSASAPALPVQPDKEEADEEESEGEPTMEDLACPDDECEDGEQDWAQSREEVAAARAAMKRAHYAGCCKPCQYFAFKADSCRKGDSCLFCHLCTREEVQARRRAQRRRSLQNSIAQIRTRGVGGKLPTRVTRSQRYSKTPWAPEGPRAPRPNVHAGQLAAPPVPIREVAPARAPPVGPSPGLREISRHHFPSAVGAAPTLAPPPGNHWSPGLQTRVTKVAGGKLQIRVGAVAPR